MKAESVIYKRVVRINCYLYVVVFNICSLNHLIKMIITRKFANPFSIGADLSVSISTACNSWRATTLVCVYKRPGLPRFCEDFLFFIPAASGLMALSKMWEIQIGSQCSSEIMQDGDFLRFFFKLSSQASFFGRVTEKIENEMF